MSSAITWREDLSSRNVPPASTLLREATIDNRLNALREVALTLLDAVDSLWSSHTARDHHMKLHDEVRQFEADLIRTALEQTAGNQARAARLLGVKHTTLNAKIKRYRIACDDNKVAADKEVGDREIAA